jgi:hypothetical protein
MSKFFIQLLLSIMLGVSAAVGFSPEAREKVHAAWDEAKAFVQETVQAALETVEEVEIQHEASANASFKSDVDAEVSTQVDTGVRAESGADAEANLKAGTEAKLEDVTLELENQIESAADLNLGFDK